MAGPYKDKQGVNVDEIMQAGLQGTGVGAPTSTATASTPPIPSPGNPMNGANTQTGRGLSIDVTAPDWAWRPTQQDFGQVDVRRGQYDTGMVPTVNVQMPFSALANRQEAINQRKAALEAKMAQYDPYGGIGKAHDRYQYAFNKWATGYIDNKRKELADQMFGGDMREADKFLGTDPMGQTMLKKWGNTANSIGTTNKAVTDSNIDLLAKVTSGELYVPPQYLGPIIKSASATGADGMPVQGLDEDEFLGTLNEAEARLREVQYVSDVIKPAMDKALKTMTGESIEAKRRGGKLVLTKREEQSFDDALRYFVNSEDGQDFVRAYHGGDKASALEALKSFYPTSIEEDITLESPYSPPASSSASAKDGKTWVGNPSRVVMASTSSGPSGETLAVEGYRLPFGQEVSGRNENMGDRVFIDSDENSINMKPEAVVYIPSEDQYYVEGKLTTDQTIETSVMATGSASRSGKKRTETRKANEVYRVPLTGSNEESLRSYLPDFDWRSRFSGIGQSESAPASPSSNTAGTLSRSTIKKLVGKEGYRDYTEQELVDYYKSQGYNIE